MCKITQLKSHQFQNLTALRTAHPRDAPNNLDLQTYQDAFDQVLQGRPVTDRAGRRSELGCHVVNAQKTRLIGLSRMSRVSQLMKVGLHQSIRRWYREAVVIGSSIRQNYLSFVVGLSLIALYERIDANKVNRLYPAAVGTLGQMSIYFVTSLRL